MSIASNAGQAGSMGMGAAAPASAERTASAYAKVTRRIVPFIVLCYFFSYLDRVNVGFAKLQMQQALGERRGLRHRRRDLLLGLHVVPGAQQPVDLQAGHAALHGGHHDPVGPGVGGHHAGDDPTEFYVARFLLGVTEAGFFRPPSCT